MILTYYDKSTLLLFCIPPKAELRTNQLPDNPNRHFHRYCRPHSYFVMKVKMNSGLSIQYFIVPKLGLAQLRCSLVIFLPFSGTFSMCVMSGDPRQCFREILLPTTVKQPFFSLTVSSKRKPFNLNH